MSYAAEAYALSKWLLPEELTYRLMQSRNEADGIADGIADEIEREGKVACLYGASAPLRAQAGLSAFPRAVYDGVIASGEALRAMTMPLNGSRRSVSDPPAVSIDHKQPALTVSQICSRQWTAASSPSAAGPQGLPL